MRDRIKVGVLYGGISSERDVSINTGKQISENLDRDKYEVHEILMDKKEDIFKCKGMDFVFIALHGEFGEDGQCQSILDAMGVRYNGCGFKTSSICMDKYLVKKVLEDYKVPMAKGRLINKEDDITEFDLSFPVVIKPNFGGSSLGVIISKNKEEFLHDIENVFKYDDSVLVEEFISGQEITVGILNDEALPILKIVPQNHEFFNYTSKYDNTTIEEPIELDEELDKEIKELSKRCYKVLNCRVYSRVDFILKDNVPHFLEINTLPGMTEGSLFPKMAKLRGMSFIELIDNIIENSME